MQLFNTGLEQNYVDFLITKTKARLFKENMHQGKTQLTEEISMGTT